PRSQATRLAHASNGETPAGSDPGGTTGHTASGGERADARLLGLEHDIPRGGGEDDACGRRRARAYGDRELVVAEPAREALRVTADVQLCDLDGAGRVAGPGAAGEWCRVPPFDEEGKRGLRRGLLDAGRSPAQELTTSSNS